MPQSHLTILGAGAMGMAIGVILGDSNSKITYWDIESEVADAIHNIHQNPRSMPNLKMPKGVKGEKNIAKAVMDADMVVFSMASPFVRQAGLQIKNHLPANCVVVVAAKGLERESNMTMAQVLSETLGGNFHDRIVVLSGPTLAPELAKRQPAASMMASLKDNPYSKRAVSAFSNDWFRVYESRDVTGVELAGVGK